MRKYLVFVLSIFFAFILWLIVNLQNDYEAEFQIPLVIENVNEDRALKNEIPEKVEIKVVGQGWKLLPFYFSRGLKAVIDAKGIVRNLTVRLPNDHRVKFLIPHNVKIDYARPETINVEFEKRISKIVPIKLDAEFRIPEDRGLVEPPILNPDSALVLGAESIVSKIDSVLTEKILIKEGEGNIKFRLKILSPSRIVDIEPREVDVSFWIEQIVEREFTVPVQVNFVPADKEVLLFPPSVRVVLKGGLSKIADFTDTTIKASLDYDEIVKDKTGLVKPRISVPRGFSLIGVYPEGVEYIIRQK